MNEDGQQIKKKMVKTEIRIESLLKDRVIYLTRFKFFLV